MVKYIIKRILIAVLILFGVSVIVYTLVRLMPNDYVDTKYSSQLSTGAITQDDIDNFKSLYGLYTPEARLYIEIDGYDGVFTHDVKKVAYDTAVDTSTSSQDNVSMFVCGANKDRKAFTYKNGEIRTDEDSALRLDLVGDEDEGNFTFNLYRLRYEKHEEEVEEVNERGEKVKVIKVIREAIKDPIASGSFAAEYADGNLYINFVSSSGPSLKADIKYSVTSFGEKLGTIFSGYFTWLGNLMKGDLGVSFKYSKPVGQVISENMWISFAIAIVATILQFLIAIPLGISSATHQYSAQDYIVTVFTMIGISLPTYFFAAIVVKIFSVDLGWLPANGLIYASASYPETFLGALQKLGDMIQHLILPISVSVILSIGGLMRYTRTNTLEVLSADYIRTARAKGLSEKTVIYKHAFRNTLIPLATLLAGILPGLFGGMMITEQVFGIDGIGRLAYNALREGDIPFVMGYNMFLAILTVIGTLLSDIMYSIVDPRVKLGR